MRVRSIFVKDINMFRRDNDELIYASPGVLPCRAVSFVSVVVSRGRRAVADNMRRRRIDEDDSKQQQQFMMERDWLCCQMLCNATQLFCPCTRSRSYLFCVCVVTAFGPQNTAVVRTRIMSGKFCVFFLFCSFCYTRWQRSAPRTIQFLFLFVLKTIILAASASRSKRYSLLHPISDDARCRCRLSTNLFLGSKLWHCFVYAIIYIYECCVCFVFFLLLSSSLSLLYKLFLPLHVLTSKQSSKNIFQRINSNINNMFFNMYIPDVFPAFLIFLQNNNRAHKIAYNNVYRNLCTILFC